jgi:hypothetical protein
VEELQITPTQFQEAVSNQSSNNVARFQPVITKYIFSLSMTSVSENPLIFAPAYERERERGFFETDERERK